VLDEAIAPEEFPALVGEGDLDRIEDDHRQTYSEASTGTAAMYVLFVSGRMPVETYGGEVLGLAYRAGSLALFLDTADQGTNLFVTSEEVAGAALVHEAGHLLGLVNNGVPMVAPHEDTDHPAHDLDPKSIMYWYVQVPRVAPSLGDPGFAQFNAACLADLAAFGGRSDADAPAPSSATIKRP